MKDQHEKITGYRDLSQEEIDLMNEIKTKGEELRELHAKMERLAMGGTMAPVRIDPRWLAEGRTDLQKGIMCLVRAVARPTTF